MEKKLANRKVAVLVEELYEETELLYPAIRLKEEGAHVVIAGTGRVEYRGKHGYPVEADTGVDKLSADELDALVIPGGFAPDRLRRHSSVLSLVRTMLEQDKVVAAICHAGWVLISAGVIKGRRATGAAAIRDDMVNAGANYVDAEVVRDGKMITSRGPDDLGAFCREIIAALSAVEASLETAYAAEGVGLDARSSEGGPEPSGVGEGVASETELLGVAPEAAGEELAGLAPGATEVSIVEAVIEIPRGSRNKYEMDHEAGLIRLDRVLYSSVHYPTDYGFVPGTMSPDGDPLDILVLVEEPTFPGCRVEARPVGALIMRDEAGVDEKILAVPVADPRFENIRDLSDVQRHWLLEIENFFATYKMLEGKETWMEGWRDAAEARAILSRSFVQRPERAA